jgi:endoglucanase
MSEQTISLTQDAPFEPYALLKELVCLHGGSGDEGAVRDKLAALVRPFVDEMHVDAMGNLVCLKKGTGTGPRVMLAAHMDEVSLMVTGMADMGLLRFRTVGGIDPRILIGKRVLVGKEGLPGVIGVKPIHLQTPGDRKTAVKIRDLRIDIGATDKAQAEGLVQPGDRAVFDYEPVEYGDGKLMAKGLDDRAGCAVLAWLLTQRQEYDVYGCFTVQEEVGLRGAKTAAYAVMPEYALVLEGTTCYDVPDTKEHLMSTWQGRGPALTVMDRAVISNRPFVDFITEVAEREGIPCQFKQTLSGGTDAGRIQANGAGVKVATMAVPCRYIHTPVSVMDRADFDAMLRLARATLASLPEFFARV